MFVAVLGAEITGKIYSGVRQGPGADKEGLLDSSAGAH